MRVNKSLMARARRRKDFRQLEANLRAADYSQTEIREFVRLAPRGYLEEYLSKVDKLIDVRNHVEGFNPLEHLKLERSYRRSMTTIVVGELFVAPLILSPVTAYMFGRNTSLEILSGLLFLGGIGCLAGGAAKACWNSMFRTPPWKMNRPYSAKERGYDNW